MPAPDRKRRLTAFVVAMAVLIATPLAVIASDQFSDVPDSNVFHDDIRWLADADITKGCNPPDNTQFCPKDEVTREQMSAFMRRFAQYIGAEDGTPAQADNATTADTAATAETATNATQLAGLPGDAYQSVLGAAVGSHAHGTGLGTVGAGAPFEASSVTVDVPRAGVLIITGSSGWETGDTWFTQWLEIDEETACDLWPSTDRIPGSGTEGSDDGNGASLTSPGIIEVSAGTHTVSLCLWAFSSSSSSLNVSHSLIVEHQSSSDVSIASLGLASETPAPTGGPSAP